MGELVGLIHEAIGQGDWCSVVRYGSQLYGVASSSGNAALAEVAGDAVAAALLVAEHPIFASPLARVVGERLAGRRSCG